MSATEETVVVEVQTETPRITISGTPTPPSPVPSPRVSIPTNIRRLFERFREQRASSSSSAASAAVPQLALPTAPGVPRAASPATPSPTSSRRKGGVPVIAPPPVPPPPVLTRSISPATTPPLPASSTPTAAASLGIDLDFSAADALNALDPGAARSPSPTMSSTSPPTTTTAAAVGLSKEEELPQPHRERFIRRVASSLFARSSKKQGNSSCPSSPTSPSRQFHLPQQQQATVLASPKASAAALALALGDDQVRTRAASAPTDPEQDTTAAAAAAAAAETTTATTASPLSFVPPYPGYVPGTPPPEEEPTPEQIAMKRRHCLDEVVSSEEIYVTKLTTIVDVFVKPLSAVKSDPEKAIISAAEIQQIFSHVEIITKYNSVLLAELKKKCEEAAGQGSQFGVVFMRLADFLKTYTPYINNFSTATAVLTELQAKNSRFCQFLVDAGRDPRCSNLNLLSLLIMSVQRNLVKYTSKDDPDLESLSKALSKVEKLAEEINVRRRDAENIAQLQQVESQLVLGDQPSLLSVPYRRYIMEGELFEFEERIVERRYCYLLTDVIVVASKSQKHRRIVRMIPLNDAHISQFNIEDGRKSIRRKKVSANPNPHTPVSAPGSNSLFAFSIDTGSDLFTLAASTAEATKQWLTETLKTVDDLESKVKTFLAKTTGTAVQSAPTVSAAAALMQAFTPPPATSPPPQSAVPAADKS